MQHKDRMVITLYGPVLLKPKGRVPQDRIAVPDTSPRLRASCGDCHMPIRKLSDYGRTP